MSFDPARHPNPAAGYYRLTAERRFMYLRQDPAHTQRIVWQKVPVTCPMCAADTGLTLAYDRAADDVVQVLCPAGHLWPEHLVDTGHFITYGDYRGFADPHPDMLWIIDAGFGEEPPPPIDYASEITGIAKYTAKYAARKGKTRIKAAVRKPMRRAKKKALNLAFAPVAAAIRGAWTLQAGGAPKAAPTARSKGNPRRKGGKGKAEFKTPSVAKYRKAYGMDTPEKGPNCLVCKDSGRITAPGISISCTECAGPAAAAMAAAERKAERARTAKPSQSRRSGTAESAAPKAPNGRTGSARGVTVAGDNDQPIRINSTSGGSPLADQDAAAVRDAVGKATRAAAAAAGRAPAGDVYVAGKNNSSIVSVTDDGATRSD
ncbi:hypothetical protein [Streptomyces sp. NBC_01361]|uniref:hypothetical protein n=1 Tax=Streptomyces sp. NBC_01361 TaxID=2903838 RepID=UPI002E348464|nr:hypothetical protein [Streptomyces sp. NBC_01361]